MSNARDKINEYFKKNKEATTADLVEATGVTRHRVWHILQEMVNKNIIEKIKTEYINERDIYKLKE